MARFSQIFFFFFLIFLGLCWVFVVAHGILVPRGSWDLSSRTRNLTRVPCIGRWILNHWPTKEAPQILTVVDDFHLLYFYFIFLFTL